MKWSSSKRKAREKPLHLPGYRVPHSVKKPQGEFYRYWDSLSEQCLDSGSLQRLSGLRQQFGSRMYGETESANAEVEMAYLLNRVGFSIAFLPESIARTADLECYLGQDRLFVEVTVIVGSPPKAFPRTLSTGKSFAGDESLEGEDPEQLFIKRIVARMTEKARQLSSYCAPVVLAITVKDQAHELGKKKQNIDLDVKRLTGVLATTFPIVSQLSAVLLTLWNVTPRESQSNVRFNTVHFIERSGKDRRMPRVRLLAFNSSAKYPLEKRTRLVLQGLL